MKEPKKKNLSVTLEISLQSGNNEDIGKFVEDVLNELAMPSVSFFHNIRKDLGTIDDFKQEFRIEAYKAAKQTNVKIGNPVDFILTRAINRLKDFINKRCNKKFYELPLGFDKKFEDDQDIEMFIDIESIIETLQGRQKEVALMLLSPKRDEKNYLKSIGQELGISPQCVSTYVRQVRQAMEVLR